MSNFNCLTPCCTPPPPPECCLTVSDLSTLFPSGLTINFGSGPINIPNEAWSSFSGCCVSVTLGPFGSIPLPNPPPSQKQCSSLWSYNSSEEYRVRYMVREFETVSASGTTPTPCATPCPEPDLLEDFRNDVLIQKRGEAAFGTKIELAGVTIVIGKAFRNCGYGDPICVYTIAITFEYFIYMNTTISTRYYMKVTGTDILERCSDDSYVDEILQDAQFPVCNYASDPSTLMGTWTVTRAKVLTNLTSPLVFNPNDPTPEWCDLPGACGGYPTEQTLELCIDTIDDRPVYSQRTKSTYTIDVGCYFGYNFTDTDDPENSRCYTVYADSTRTYDLETLGDPTPPGIALPQELPVLNPKALVNCEWVCQGDLEGFTYDCRTDPFGIVLPFPPKYIWVGNLIDLLSFSYTGTSASLPLCHTYNSPNWTLTF